MDILGALGVADDRDDAGGAGGQPCQRRARVGEEVLLEQEVLGRVARQRELGEADELRAGLAGLHGELRDPRLVAGDVADDGVELGERDAQRGGHGVNRPSVACDGDVRRPSGERDAQRAVTARSARASSRRTRASAGRRGRSR